eukprot:TRINITY_DN41885_c0_g1_i1.p1 TRINITY_DN41885_c0_g1~~TRINITY_DN41885_c0_g1_i1.p1  ORF type:complete len:1360 (+),score=211.36 TRINITY_DN41885_c0_g1_i1:72-4082(+)
MSGGSLFRAPHPLVPLATFDVGDADASGGAGGQTPRRRGVPLRGLGIGSTTDESEIALVSGAHPAAVFAVTEIADDSRAGSVVASASEDVGCTRASGSVSTSPSAVKTFDVSVDNAGSGVSTCDAAYSLFPSSEAPEDGGGPGAPDFLGRLHHLKTLFRMSQTTDPVSVMIHRVGPMLILDDGPYGWSRDAANHRPADPPLPPLQTSLQDTQGGAAIDEAQLMLAALDPSLEGSLLHGPPGLGPPVKDPIGERACTPPPGLTAKAPPSELLSRLFVKNTFLDIMEEAGSEGENDETLQRSWSAPPTVDGSVVCSDFVGNDSGTLSMAIGTYSSSPHQVTTSQLPSRTAEEVDTSNSWSLIPYRCNEDDLQKLGDGSQSWDLLQLASPQERDSKQDLWRTFDAMRNLFKDIPPEPSRCGRAVEWQCGCYKVLLGCDMVVFRSSDFSQQSPSNLASFKMQQPGGNSEPTREQRLDLYLENIMCDIKKAVWGCHDDGETAWRVFNTKDLPAGTSPGEEAGFDAKQLVDQGQRLLHFLRQQCHREGGTYWLFRERNSPVVELFDLCDSSDPSANDGAEKWSSTSRAFATSEPLVLPIASLCFHLAKSMPNSSDQRQLLQKGLQLLDRCKHEHAGLYSLMSLQLAGSYMRTPLPALLDKSVGCADGRSRTSSFAPKAQASVVETPPAARLSVALRYLEGVLKLLTSRDNGEQTPEEVSMHAQLLVQAHVFYADCVVKLVREAMIPTYSGWLSEVQRASNELLMGQTSPLRGTNGPADSLVYMKRLSVAFLLWRLFWLCRAQKALAHLSQEKRDIECWTLERDLNEAMGDALFGLSRYPADDVDDLLAAEMRSAEGICSLVEDGLRSYGLSGPRSAHSPASAEVPLPRSRRRGKRLTSPTSSPSPRHDDGDTDSIKKPHNVDAMFLSKLNPLRRGIGDDAIRDDPLVRDDLRRRLWTDGKAFRQSLVLFEKAASRLLRKREKADNSGGGVSSLEEQATMRVARKLAHLHNEEARTALMRGDGEQDIDAIDELLTTAHRWMLLSGDLSNASRVLLNLSELHARRAERPVALKNGSGENSPHLTESQYEFWLKAISCCEAAADLSEQTVGRREGAFAHLRVGVHLSVRVPSQSHLHEATRHDSSTLAELSDRHFSKALRAFDELKDEREVAVCHFHIADLALQEQRVPGAAALSKARLTSALRHARRSADFWDRSGALVYAKDFLASHVRVAQLLELQPRSNSVVEAIEHLGEVESRLLALASATSSVLDSSILVLDGLQAVAVVPLRREMSRVCQAGLRRGGDVDTLKGLYRHILRNEPINGRKAAKQRCNLQEAGANSRKEP